MTTPTRKAKRPPAKPRRSTRATPRQGTSYVTAPASAPLAEGHPLLDFAPYLHKAPRANSITPTKQRRFVAELAATGIVTHAAIKIGVSMEALYKLRNKPGAEGFKAAWDAAVDMGVDRLEASALARATEGEAVWRYDPGGQYWFEDGERKYNENLVMFFLRNRRPEKYATDVRPGHPLYERIRREVLGELMQEAGRNEADVLALLGAKIDALRDARDAAERGAGDERGGGADGGSDGA